MFFYLGTISLTYKYLVVWPVWNFTSVFTKNINYPQLTKGWAGEILKHLCICTYVHVCICHVFRPFNTFRDTFAVGSKVYPSVLWLLSVNCEVYPSVIWLLSVNCEVYPSVIWLLSVNCEVYPSVLWLLSVNCEVYPSELWLLSVYNTICSSMPWLLTVSSKAYLSLRWSVDLFYVVPSTLFQRFPVP